MSSEADCSDEHPRSSFPETDSENENLPTIDELAAARKARQTPSAAPVQASEVAPAVEELEEEAEGEGAFNPETGEINWDCPCLGGMAHGPCGPEFREAFSCFVYSKEEPKGMDCVDKFGGMQECFRKHPDIYGEELADDDEDSDRVPLDGSEQGQTVAKTSTEASSVAETSAGTPGAPDSKVPIGKDSPHVLASEKIQKDKGASEADDLVPRAWHDERGSNEKKES